MIAVLFHVARYRVTIAFIWSVPVDCGDPSSPVNGFVMAYDSTLEGSQIVFQCSPGFVPSQQMMSVCATNGSWTPDPAELVCMLPLQGVAKSKL